MPRRNHTDDDLFPPTMGAPAPPAYRVRCVVCGQARPRVFLDGIELCERLRAQPEIASAAFATRLRRIWWSWRRVACTRGISAARS